MVKFMVSLIVATDVYAMMVVFRISIVDSLMVVYSSKSSETIAYVLEYVM